MNWKKKICIGTPQFGGNYGITNNKKKKIKLEDIRNIFKLIKKSKINFLDTALSYKIAENNIFKSNVNTLNLEIITKIPKPKNEKNYENKIIKDILKSKNRFKIKKFHKVLIHDSTNLKKKDFRKILSTFNLLKKKKLTKNIGFSIYTKKQYDNIIKYCNPDVLQIPLNVLDRTFLKKRFLTDIKKRKVKLHVRSIFLQGLLLADMKLIKGKFKKWKYIFQEWELFCNKNNYSKINVATNFILKHNFVNKIIVGFYNQNELLEFLKIKKTRLNIPNFIKKNEKAVEKLIKPYNWSSTK